MLSKLFPYLAIPFLLGGIYAAGTAYIKSVKATSYQEGVEATKKKLSEVTVLNDKSNREVEQKTVEMIKYITVDTQEKIAKKDEELAQVQAQVQADTVNNPEQDKCEISQEALDAINKVKE